MRLVCIPTVVLDELEEVYETKKASKKGFEPLLAAILLVLLTVMVGILYMVWVSSLAQTIMHTTDKILQTLTFPDILTLDAYSVESGGSVLKLFVRNTGPATSIVSRVYVLKEGTLIKKKDLRLMLEPGEVKEIVLHFNEKLHGKYKVVIVTVKGYRFEFTIETCY